MKRSLVISGAAHAVLLLWGLVAFAARPSEAPPTEPLPVEFVSATEFSQLTAGVKNAPKPIENAKPLADKVGEAKPVKELAPKVADKPEIRTDSAPPPEPKPETKAAPKAAEKSEPKPEPKAEPKPAEKAEKQKDKPKPDQIADESKKDEAKKPPKPEKKQPEFKPDQIAEELKREEAKKPPRPAPKFDANQVAALLDHREPHASVGDRRDPQWRRRSWRLDRSRRASLAERDRRAASEIEVGCGIRPPPLSVTSGSEYRHHSHQACARPPAGRSAGGTDQGRRSVV